MPIHIGWVHLAAKLDKAVSGVVLGHTSIAVTADHKWVLADHTNSAVVVHNRPVQLVQERLRQQLAVLLRWLESSMLDP